LRRQYPSFAQHIVAARDVAAPFTRPGETIPKNAAPSLGRDTDVILAACLQDCNVVAQRRDLARTEVTLSCIDAIGIRCGWTVAGSATRCEVALPLGEDAS
jgi:hypothetical protein